MLKILNERELLPAFEHRLQELLRLPKHLLVSELRVEPLRPSSTIQIDLQARVEIDGRSILIICEVKKSGQPAIVRRALEQLRFYASQLDSADETYGILMAPFVSEDSARLCLEFGMGYLDLAGNAHVEFDNVYVETRTAERPSLEKRENRPLFSAKGERVLKVLLTPPLRPWKVTELSAASGVSLGQVSTVRGHLLQRNWAIADERGVRIHRPMDLAKHWQSVYKRRLVDLRQGYTLQHGKLFEESIRLAMTESGNGEQLIYASYSAARWLAPYARNSMSYLYATESGFELLKRHLNIESTTRGENITVWIPREEDVFNHRLQPAVGIWCSGLVQTWLDLSISGDRGQEAAEHLLNQKLLSEWGEVGG